MLSINNRIKEDIDRYIVGHSNNEDEVLHQLFRETHLKAMQPRMVSGAYQGQILTMLSKMIKPSAILEIGTFTGYSAICLARGLKDGGVLHTIEINDELEHLAKKYFRKAGLEKVIHTHIGDALEIIDSLDAKFDMVFIDADKSQYLDYYHLVFPKLNSGGVVIADNVLWDGKVIEKPAANDKYTRGILEFNQFVKADNRVDKVILPIRDGITLIYKN